MQPDVRGQNVLVTGGASGIGRVLVDRLAALGARVMVFDIDRAAVDAMRDPARGIDAEACDVSDSDQVEAAVARYSEAVGEIHVLVNNAAVVYSAPLIDVLGGFRKHGVERWRQVIDTDLSAVFYVTVNVVEKMLRQRTRGVIVNVSSIAAAGNPGQSAYAAAKAGVEALTRTWARELGPAGIRCVCIAPGFTDTETTAGALSEATARDLRNRTPARRFATPEEVADAILFLLASDFANGRVLRLDGGLVL